MQKFILHARTSRNKSLKSVKFTALKTQNWIMQTDFGTLKPILQFFGEKYCGFAFHGLTGNCLAGLWIVLYQ